MRKFAFFFLLFPVLFVQGAEQLPVEYFFKNPEFQDPEISPDGKTLAVLMPFRGVMNVAVFDLEKREPRILTGEDQDVTRIAWANNDYILYWKDAPTTEGERMRYYGGVYVVDKMGKEARALVRPYSSRGAGFGGRAPTGEDGYGSIRYLDRYDADPDYVVVSNNARKAKYPDLFLMNVRTGRMKRFIRNTESFSGYETDATGTPRFAYRSSDEFDEVINRTYIYFLDPKTEEWRELTHFDSMDSRWYPVYFEPDSGKLYVSSNVGRDKKAIFLYDWEENRLESEPVFEDDTYDISGGVLEGLLSSRVVGVIYDAEKPKIRYLDDQYAKMQELIDQALPDTFNVVISADDSAKRLIIASYSDVQPPVYSLLHLDQLRMEKLFESMPWVQSKDLCPKMPVSFEASDGMTIHGYLTLPKTYSEGNPVPLIVNPHGGPWARDSWGINWYYDMEPQYFANRGFAVLQVNFRGSTGYGSAYLEAHLKNVHRMHLDWLDGVKWAIAEGYADPDNIGIVGASWGGYSTMYGLTKFPEVFNFGINMMGVVDVPEQIKTYRDWGRETGYAYWVERIGDPADPEELEMLEEASPINYVENIDDPVLIYHGIHDFNVDIEQARMLISAMRKADKDYQAILRTDETHTAYEEEDRISFYKEVDKFLKPFLPKQE